MPEINKHAVLIGINDVPKMEYLDTPSYYAIQMQNWAIDQGYKTKLFVDVPNGEITGICSRIEILKAICNIIEQGTDQLLIYFSGHGVEHTAGNDVWLLPNYENDSSDCISIFLNKALAYTSGIPHVVFISDACRVPSSHQALRAASGAGILPILDNINPDTEIDVLYSTWPGQPAMDIRNEDGSYRSIYSDCLLSCLNGHVPEVIKQIQNVTPGFPVVFSDELSRYLKKIVPIQTATLGKRQLPMGDVTSKDPLYLSSFNNDSAALVKSDLSLVIPHETIVRTKTISYKLEAFMQMRGTRAETKIPNTIWNFNRDHDFFTSPEVFDRHLTGLFVTGIHKPFVFSKREIDLKYHRKRNFLIPQIIDFDDRLPHLEDTNENVFLIGNPRTKRFYPVSMLPGFFTQVVFEKGEILTVNYFPTSGWRKQEAHHLAEEVARRKLIIITAAKNGIFQGSEEIADFIRSHKSLDPTLGLFAAYAYFQKGNYEGVQSVFRYMDREDESVLGDVILLKYLSNKIKNVENFLRIPIPMLTEGWSYLKLLPQNPYSYLSTQLQPGLWTSFSREGLQYLIENQNYTRI